MGRKNVTLVEIEPRRKLFNWTLDSGSVYKVRFPYDDDTKLITFEATKVRQGQSTFLMKMLTRTELDFSAGSFYHNVLDRWLFLRTTDSTNPNDRYNIYAYYVWPLCTQIP